MAHECPRCGMECYCHGDIDDCVVSLPRESCECDCQLDDSTADGWTDDDEQEDDDA